MQNLLAQCTRGDPVVRIEHEQSICGQMKCGASRKGQRHYCLLVSQTVFSLQKQAPFWRFHQILIVRLPLYSPEPNWMQFTPQLEWSHFHSCSLCSLLLLINLLSKNNNMSFSWGNPVIMETIFKWSYLVLPSLPPCLLLLPHFSAVISNFPTQSWTFTTLFN